ncbi:MAG TPA: SAM-dependent methyltransferase [Methylophaga aminisulfidivorans]|uniref:SAM-dependent methyltransferase n=1 Tax=Methylophaga aminisulfidivorans TaxID=230105 RepID=A0A7C2A769_9GAMM|nr:SAM-dependent methyltransferase [Methylophaga aminisulfidivorans]
MNEKLTLSTLDTLSRAHHTSLKKSIKQAIKKNAGSISFKDYMQMCLYEPGLGYYSAGRHKLGKGGDFTTAPEISPLFGSSLAENIRQVFDQLNNQDILEFGAGSGKLAIDVVSRLKDVNQLPRYYFIVEISADLKQRQQAAISKALPELLDHFIWIDDIPDQFQGVIIANEVCDAMPVNIVLSNNGELFERHVSYKDATFYWQDASISDANLLHQTEAIFDEIVLPTYQTEINLTAQYWMERLGQALQQGVIFIIDYGYNHQDFYHPERDQGTLQCYFNQQAHSDPLILAGMQDITAHIDFSKLAEIAQSSGLDVSAYHYQSDFLVAGGIMELASELHTINDEVSWLQHSAGLKQLLFPTGMGAEFKVLTLSREITFSPTFLLKDRRHQL